MFGTALSSCINFFLSTDGQASAVGTIVSAGYGFICGAYMPISSFGTGLQKALSFLPGTYGTSLLRNHTLRGTFAEMQRHGLPARRWWRPSATAWTATCISSTIRCPTARCI